jgi:23S rRNA (cytidine1920-2'-O)/16S rRNA (cytidine1409-2'-O)-methyltransferase
MKNKDRLDKIVLSRWPNHSRRAIQSWIMQGKVRVDGKVVSKAGALTELNADIVLSIEKPKFVSRAGYKLEKALDYFSLSVEDFIVLDAGVSTGGFTDCLLQRGVRTVYGVDVGYGQVHEKIRADTRVILMEKTNLRTVRDVGQKVDLVTLDLSFISVAKVLDAVCAVLKSDGAVIVLIKPQFELQKKNVGRGGIVRDEALHQKAIESVVYAFKAREFEYVGLVSSPIKGASGNQEFLAYFRY